MTSGNIVNRIYPVILCGGAGTRLWPISRRSYPKQFAKFLGNETLFQGSVRRFTAPIFAPPVVVTGTDFRFVVTEQLKELDIQPSDILIEPFSRNTAAAICAAALRLAETDPNGLMLVAPSDHLIPVAEDFQMAVETALKAANEGQLVTFGISPNRAETGYGWLEVGNSIESDQPQPIKSFVEKPKLKVAEEMLAARTYLWNAGIFLFSVKAILNAFSQYAPQTKELVSQSIENSQSDLGFLKLAQAPWQDLEDISIDYGIMEKANNLAVVPFKGAWSDLGDWEAVWRESEQDLHKVATIGAATAIDCQDSLLLSSEDSQALVGIGLNNIVAVSMPDAVLVAKKDDAQQVKLAVQKLASEGISQAETLPRDYRPWGWFQSLAVGARFQVKKIVVHPGASLSLQSHHHRSEHWIVVGGTALVTVNNDVKLVTENESIYIPLGATHRMENPGKVDLTLIEVQTGAYLGEDDIVRYEDVYSRGQGAKG